MGMTLQSVPGQVPNNAARRNGSTRAPTLKKSPSAASSDSGLDKRVALSRAGCEPATSTRKQPPRQIGKKLPWLEGPARNRSPAMPGSFQESPEILGEQEDANEGDDTLQEDTEVLPQQPKLSLPGIYGDDPSFRAIGSTPTLPSRPKEAEWRTFSVSSQPRPGLKPAMSRDAVPHALGMNRKQLQVTDSSPSESGSMVSPIELPVPVLSCVQAATKSDSSQQNADGPPQTWNKDLFSDLHIPTALPQKQTVKAPRFDMELQEIRRQSKQPDDPLMGRRVSLLPAQPLIKHPTLHVIPAHLMATSDSSSSQGVSPTAVMPVRPVVKPRSMPESFNRAVTGLEGLMEEAIIAAQEAADKGRHDEAAGILDNATAALRKSTHVSGQMSSPLVLSSEDAEADAASLSSSSTSTSTSGSEAGSGYDRRSNVSSEAGTEVTAPTAFTGSAQSSRQPIVVGPCKDGPWGVPSRHASFNSGRGHKRERSAGSHSMTQTPPALYQQPSADSIVKDFAYFAPPKTAYQSPKEHIVVVQRPVQDDNVEAGPRKSRALRRLEPISTDSLPVRSSSLNGGYNRTPEDPPGTTRRRGKRRSDHPHLEAALESPYYHGTGPGGTAGPSRATTSRSRYDPNPTYPHPRDVERGSKQSRYSAPPGLVTQGVSLKHPRRNHISLREGQGFSLGRHHKRQPIAREWRTGRKRLTAAVTCFNTLFIGLIAGIYAGEVPKIQYVLADQSHKILMGNVLLYCGLAITTVLFWPLPLLHGRKPYTLVAFTLMLPLQFPQAVSVSAYRDPDSPVYRVFLLLPRLLTGMAMGFANINLLPTLFDLFGASLMSEKPHGELVLIDDVRRQGGGIGLWLGLWTWCFIGSLSIGFSIGAGIIAHLDPAWGFYIVVILLALFLLVNVISPETRRAPYRRSIAHFVDEEENVKRRVARGEVKLHISNDGPKWWFQECWAGLVLMRRMVFQPGFFVLMSYIAWIYAEVVLVILLLGALLSRDFQWHSQYVGLASLAIAAGALLAVPLARANVFSRARTSPPRTDSMTFQPRVTWTSHLVRRCIFTLTLPFAGLAYTLSSPGPTVSWVIPVVFSGMLGFLSNLAIAECIGILMETFDTCDLQPGVNSKHRLQSLATVTRRRRTNYSSFPRVCAGWFAAQSLGFLLAATATGVSGSITRALGAQQTTAIATGILLLITLLLMAVLWRRKEVQVIPNSVFGASAEGKSGGAWPSNDDPYWKPVVIGNPSGKVRRMNALELGSLSRWTEIRKLNKLIRT